MSHISYTVICRYLPPTVKRIIARGGDCWIGEVDNTTVLKYPQIQEKRKRELLIEAKMFDVLGSHPRIIKSKGLTEDGLLLEFAPNDANLYLKLADFQGQHFSKDGIILLDGLSLESTKAYLPRTPADHARITTDLFALGSAIYFVMMGHEVFPNLDSSNDEDEIERRFRAEEFPTDQHACSQITENCWKQCYSSAQQVLFDLKSICDATASGERSDRTAKRNSAVSSEAARPSAWLTGLCDEAQAPTVPPQIRQLVGFE